MKKKKIKIDDSVFIKKLLLDPVYFYEKFHDKTKINRPIPMRPIEKWPRTWKTTFFKSYSRFDQLVLPDPDAPEETNFINILQKRRSNRTFSKRPMTLEQLSTLLYYSAGMRDNKSPWIGNRFYPSPGARYSLEVYVLARNCELPQGIYHYNLKNHSLETVQLFDKFLYSKYFEQDWIKRSGLVIFFTAIFPRNTIKYGDRGYRHVLAETGHLGQNFYLNATAMGIGVCGIGSYSEKKLEKLFDFDGVAESIVYALAVGNLP